MTDHPPAAATTHPRRPPRRGGGHPGHPSPSFLLLTEPLVNAIGYPPFLGWALAMVVALVPSELGLLLWLGRSHAAGLPPGDEFCRWGGSPWVQATPPRGTAMTEPKTSTLDVPGAVLTYDVRAVDAGTCPALLIIGSPMGAAEFGTLAGHFTDRTVVTYDPRGSERSRRTDGAAVNAVEEHADDLHRLIAAIGAGPVDVFASSGGAVNALELVARHPGQVRTLVAHEPPALPQLPDRDEALAAASAIHDTYVRAGQGPAMAQFIALLTLDGPVPPGWAGLPAPDPAQFGMSAEDDGSRDDPLLGLNMITCTHHEHDLAALRAASTRIVIGVGAESATNLPGRAGTAVAERLGLTPAGFPGNHGGFLSLEDGGTGTAGAFAQTLREVLDAG